MKIRKLNYLMAVISILALGLLSACGGGDGPPQDASANASAVSQNVGGNRTIEFVTLDRSDSRIQPAEPVNLVIRNASDWVAVWSEHTNGITPQPPLPTIDFNTQMVIGIVRYGNNGCYSAGIKKIASGDGELVVEYVFGAPPFDLVNPMMCMQVITTPAHFVAIPESQLPVRFVSIDPS